MRSRSDSLFALAERWVDGSLVDVGDAPPLVYVAFGIAGLAVLWAYGLYGRDEYRADHTTTDDLPAIFNAVTIAAFLSLAALILAGAEAPKLPIVGWATAARHASRRCGRQAASSRVGGPSTCRTRSSSAAARSGS